MDSEVMISLLLVSPILLAQSTLLFIDAKKKGALAWLWGIWGLIQFPLPTIFYYFIVIRPYQKKLKMEEE
ncbi:transcriptional regulator [Bacillus sp. FJAT-49732]|uniref:Transcriptional regulator n=1 Tax=Lederbergia citrisecunda TaxID=2833583 RepID=A0A942YP62_9BACI|nr:transcriptional regulator [Lederbergia citrisecunda]MBS4200991.1 transcriptional regulator [Lederbergia citrisecunda]